MKELKETIGSDEKRQAVIEDCSLLIKDEVKSKRGFSGAAIKAAFAVVKAIKPGIIKHSVDSLLDDFMENLQPLYAEYQEGGASGGMESFLQARASRTADALLAITDRRAERASNKTLVKAYKKLRPKGKANVEQAAPGIGRMIDKHI